MKIKVSRFIACGAFVTVAVISTVAAPVYWDTNQATAGIGGTGIWTSGGSPKNWSTAAAGDVSGDKWTDSAASVATFGGTAGTITIDTSAPTITAALDFTAAGYTLAVTDHSYSGLGTLSLTNAGVTTIDFGSTVATANTIAFAASNASTWTGTLKIINYSSTLDTLKFGSSASALTATQLSKISFNIGGTLYGAQISSLGVVSAIAIPEPSTTVLFGAIAVFGLVVYKRRQQAAAS
jgi:hypothetical protein